MAAQRIIDPQINNGLGPVAFGAESHIENCEARARFWKIRNGGSMAENSNPNALPTFATTDELIDFFDSHDMGDYAGSLPEMEFEVNLKHRRHLVDIDEALMSEVNDIARRRHVSSRSLIESWIREKTGQTATS